ncbi:MAG TPA: hypothetical protein VG432_04810 [Gemmatimonadaceae bacterium]|nr:hypothetical protein [Gemmatimonadaceae bacterium]
MLHVIALLSILPGCRGNAADATVIVPDSSSGRDSLEVVAPPGDPASPRSSNPVPDPVAASATAADSVAALDARFQQERTALNAESRAMQSGDRRSPGYAQRFDAWRRRALAADSIRALRDKLRARSRRSAPPATTGRAAAGG